MASWDRVQRTNTCGKMCKVRTATKMDSATFLSELVNRAANRAISDIGFLRAWAHMGLDIGPNRATIGLGARFGPVEIGRESAGRLGLLILANPVSFHLPLGKPGHFRRSQDAPPRPC